MLSLNIGVQYYTQSVKQNKYYRKDLCYSSTCQARYFSVFFFKYFPKLLEKFHLSSSRGISLLISLL